MGDSLEVCLKTLERMGKSTFITQVCIQSLQEYSQDEGLYSFVLLCVFLAWFGFRLCYAKQYSHCTVQIKYRRRVS